MSSAAGGGKTPGMASARSVPAVRPDVRGLGGLLVDPVAVLATVLAAWVLLPSVAAPPKVVWVLTLGGVGLVANALWWHRARLHASTPALCLAVVVGCQAVSTWHDGTMTDLVTSVLAGLLPIGACLLASHLGRDDVD